MSGRDRLKYLLVPALDPLRTVFERLRALPWPEPMQRLARRGLERLLARIPELSVLLDPARKPRRERARAAPPNALPELLGQLSARDYQTRARAAEGLAQQREPEAISALIAALRDRSVEVAVAAATALSEAGSERARAALLVVLDNEEGYYHSLTRAAAVHGLGPLLAGEQRAPLVRALRDRDAEVSIAAIGVLSAAVGGDALEELLRVVENAEGFYLPITRLAAARALERVPATASGELERLRAREADALVAEVLEQLLVRSRDSAAVRS